MYSKQTSHRDTYMYIHAYIFIDMTALRKCKKITFAKLCFFFITTIYLY